MKTKEDLTTLLTASAASAALGTAVESGLLWLLAENPLDGDGVARALNIPGKRCRYWLQFLEALGILEKGSQGYEPSPPARSAFLERRSRESWQYLAMEQRERTAGVHNLALYIGEPGSVWAAQKDWAAQGLTEPKHYVAKMRADPGQARDFTRMLYEIHQYLGEELAALLDMQGVRRLMDPGGGSGVVSMALLRKHPGLKVTVVDIENVCVAGREIAAENALSDRISYHPAELEKDELPAGFDMVLLCDVGLFGEALYRKLGASLNPGGRLVIVFHFSPADNVPPPSRLEWTFLDSLEDPEFAIPTVAQTQADLIRAGFRPLPGEHTLSDNRVVIQAQKV